MFLLIGLYFLISIYFIINLSSADANEEIALDEHVRNQQTFIHGRDAYIYKYIPRVRLLLSHKIN